MLQMGIHYSFNSFSIDSTDTDDLIADKLQNLFIMLNSFEVKDRKIVSGIITFKVSFNNEAYTIVISRVEKRTFDFIQQQHLKHAVFFHDSTPSFELIKVIQHADADLLTVDDLNTVCAMINLTGINTYNNRFYSKVVNYFNREKEEVYGI